MTQLTSFGWGFPEIYIFIDLMLHYFVHKNILVL